MNKDPFLKSVLKTDHCIVCLYFFEYSTDVLKKKTKVLDIFNTDKKCFMKINIETSPRSIDMDKDLFSQQMQIPFTDINNEINRVFNTSTLYFKLKK